MVTAAGIPVIEWRGPGSLDQVIRDTIAEMSLLGGLLVNPQAWDKVADIISADDFYRKDHRVIFRAIAELIESGNPCDVVTLSEFLDKR